MMALDDGLRDALQRLESDIAITLQLHYLLPILRRKRLVTQSEFQQFSSDEKESDLKKNRKLIRIITGKGEDAFDLFIEALQEEEEHLGHGSIAKKLADEKKQLKAAESKVCLMNQRESLTQWFYQLATSSIILLHSYTNQMLSIILIDNA